MKLRLMPLAQRQVEKERREWRARRDHVDIFDDELAEVLRFILQSSLAGRRARRKGREAVSRFGMRKTQLLMYYRFDAAEVVILSVWPMRKRSAPRL